jgi:Tfp pilus assembly protein PilF
MAEEDLTVTIHVGASELRVPRSNIESIERGISVPFVKMQLEKSKAAGDALMRKGDPEGARRIYEATQVELDSVLEQLGEEVPEELAQFGKDLEAARLQTIPPDPVSQKAEQAFQKGLKHIDHVQYLDAFGALKEAAALAPNRADIQLQLAQTATRVDQIQDAVTAYRAVLNLDAETYYPRISQPYLELLHIRGTQLLKDRKAEDAIPIYEEILLVQGSGRNAAVSASEFMARRATRTTEEPDKVLMEVYKYADSNDLVDLAFAAVTKIEAAGSEDPEIKKLVQETRFLSQFKSAIDTGDLRQAAHLLAQTDESVMSDRVTERVKRFAGGQAVELESQRLLEEAKSAFAESRYGDAIEHSKKILLSYSESAAASEATTILAQSELELKIKEQLDEALKLLEAARDEEATQKVAEILTIDGIDKSVQYAKVKQLEARIPQEGEAENEWLLAKAEIDENRFDEALNRLDALVAKYPETRAGKRATTWLSDYRDRLRRESQKYHPVETDFISALSNPSLWRAAAYPPPSGRDLSVPPIPDDARSQAMAAFRSVMGEDSKGHSAAEVHWPKEVFIVPAGIAIVLLLWVLWRFARPGRGRFVDHEKLKEGEENGAAANHLECRACGNTLGEDDLACAVCGVATLLSEEEEVRRTDDQRRSNYDPWKVRVTAFELNQFDVHFQKAKDLATTSDVQAAIEECRKALREDPHRVDGYALLAELYERVGQREEAAICYREILLLDPSDTVVRQKLESTSAAPALDPGPIPLVLSISLWWLLYFVIIGLDPAWWHARAGLALIGGILTVYYLRERQKNFMMPWIAKQHTDIDIHRPIPNGRLRWRDQNHQARLLAGVITEHTGVEVPAMTTWRTLWAITCSLVLLAFLSYIAWYNSAPWALAAWPAGVVLFFYVMEIHPRILTAHVLHRHFMEENLTSWVDPHMPFEPKGSPVKPKGEFLITRQDELPIRWAFAPFPYERHRQGVLNSLQQTLNRHWAFHRFYKDARVVRDIDVPMPVGYKTAGFFSTVIMVVAVVGAIGLTAMDTDKNREYDEAMVIGYQALIDGQLKRAQEQFFRAMRLKPERAAPHLYIAHSYQTAGMDVVAERAYRCAVDRAHNVAAAHNDYGNFLQRKGRLREALEQYELALVEDPNNGDILSNAGSALYKLQEYKKASDYLKKAVAYAPSHSRAFTTLGLCLEKLGDREEARKAYEKAVKHAPNVAYTNVARNRLESDLAPEDDKPITLEVPDHASAS